VQCTVLQKLRQLQQLEPPSHTCGLMGLYEFCGFKLVGLRELHSKLVGNKADLERECKALERVLAAAKETEDVKVCYG
jgi:hypothetical protein